MSDLIQTLDLDAVDFLLGDDTPTGKPVPKTTPAEPPAEKEAKVETKLALVPKQPEAPAPAAEPSPLIPRWLVWMGLGALVYAVVNRPGSPDKAFSEVTVDDPNEFDETQERVAGLSDPPSVLKPRKRKRPSGAARRKAAALKRAAEGHAQAVPPKKARKAAEAAEPAKPAEPARAKRPSVPPRRTPGVEVLPPEVVVPPTRSANAHA